MRAKAGILIIIGMLFLVGTVAAADVSTIGISKDWVVANGVDQSTITVNVQNSMGPVNGAEVDFAVDSVYGTMSPFMITTGSDGLATSTFTVNNTSGTAIITATIIYNDGGTSITVTKTVSQYIIDQRITSATFTPSSGTVGEEIPFIISFKDQSEQPFNNQNGDVSIRLILTCPLPNDCSFVENGGHSYSSQPEEGNLAAPLHLGTKSGVTTIVMDPVQDLSEQVFMIDTKPGEWRLTAAVEPASLTVPAGTGSFTFVYTLLDKFNNPVANQPIQVETNLSESHVTYTNFFGKTPDQVYGPKANISTVIITATVLSNTSLTNQFEVAFTAPMSQDMMISASPQSMQSLDENPDSQSVVIVRVHDEFGHPISGEHITFTLGVPTYETGVPNTTYIPKLMSSEDNTDAEGKATTTFIPGRFDTKGPSLGSVLLTAHWDKNSISKSTRVNWTNRPYLNIDGDVSSTTIVKGDEIDVTINISVNGNPHYRPVSMVLDHDVSGAMSNVQDKTTRLEKATAAATVFLNSLITDEVDISVGLTSFGNDKANYPTYPVGTALQDIIDQLAVYQTSASAGEMGPSLETSIDILIAATSTGSGHEDDVKVLVMMSGGTSNLRNDEPWFTNQINRAKNNNIIIFPISYVNNEGGTPNAAVQFNRLATETGGFVSKVWSVESLSDVYADIAEKIKILADEDTEMELSFEDIVINNQPYDGSEVYEYVPVGPFVVRTSDISQVNSSGRTSIIWPDGNQTVVDQTAEWESNTLTFQVGAINLNEIWSTTFRLKVNMAGCYNVFGPDSSILLNGVPTPLPDLPICVSQTLKNEGLKTGTLNVTGLDTIPSVIENPIFTDFVPLQWNTYYNSSDNTNKNLVAIEKIYYNINGGPWIQFDVKSVSSAHVIQHIPPSPLYLDVRNLPAGNYYFRVFAQAVDAADAYNETALPAVVNRSGNYLILK